MHHTLFISDIHLEHQREDITQRFLSFLNTHAANADALYILGDLFEAWVGDDDNTPFYQTIQRAILSLSKTVPIYFMRGNRDFLIGKRFAEQTGVTILPDPHIITLYGKPVLLSHGDMLCTHDTKHQKFRTLSQNNRYNRYFLCLPLWIRRQIANMLRKKSQTHTKNIDPIIMDVSQDAVVDMMQNKQVDLLIHGHTHRPCIHQFHLEPLQLATRIVLGDWDKQAQKIALIYREDGTFSLIET